MFKIFKNKENQQIEKLLKSFFAKQNKSNPELDDELKEKLYQTIPRSFRKNRTYANNKVAWKLATGIFLVVFSLILRHFSINGCSSSQGYFQPTKIVTIELKDEKIGKFKPTKIIEIRESDCVYN